MEEALDCNAEHPALGELHGFLVTKGNPDGAMIPLRDLIRRLQGKLDPIGIFVLVHLALQHHLARHRFSKEFGAPVAWVAMANGAGSGGCNKGSGAQLLQSMDESFPFISVYITRLFPFIILDSGDPVYPQPLLYARLP